MNEEQEYKSFRTLAAELKARRKPKLSPERIERANKIFREIEEEQERLEEPQRQTDKVARQPEV